MCWLWTMGTSKTARIRTWFERQVWALAKEEDSGGLEHVVIYAYSIGVSGIVAFLRW